MDILKSEPGPCSGTCQMSSDDGNEVTGVKVEEIADMKEEEDAWPETSTGIGTEPAVSFFFFVYVYPLLFTWHRYPEFPVH
jgi:hypothetical protein